MTEGERGKKEREKEKGGVEKREEEEPTTLSLPPGN